MQHFKAEHVYLLVNL